MLRICLSFVGVLLLSSAFFSDNNHNDILSKFQQDEYRIKYERTDLVRYNKTYIKHADIRVFKYNRTNFALNGTLNLNVNFGRNLMVIVQAYKFMSNEYRYFPLRMQVNFCDAYDHNIVGFKGFESCGNFSGCPLKKGTFYICNFVQDDTKFPPLIPTGRYMLEYQLTYFGSEVMVVNGYGSIVYSMFGRY